jgi:hypothetical protein
VPRHVKWRDEKLPGLRHGFERATAEAIGVRGNAAPAKNTKAFLVGCSLDGSLGSGDGVARKESETDAELFRQFNSLLGRLCLKKVGR